MEWISVEDRLPPECHEVMYFAIIGSTDGHQTKEIMTGHREGEDWKHCCLFYSSRNLYKFVTVTHWMELPDYPNEI